jgi:hypothetical protein
MKVAKNIQYFAMFLSFRFNGYGVRIPVEARDFFFLLLNFQIGSEAHTASYSMDTGVVSRDESGWSQQCRS